MAQQLGLAGAARNIWAGALALVFGLALPIAPAGAQDGDVPTWIQLEALPNLALAEDRARAFSGELSPIAGFALGARWYIVAMGPYAPAEAAGRMNNLKSEGRIPRDAFLTDGSEHGQQFWPVGAAADLGASGLQGARAAQPAPIDPAPIDPIAEAVPAAPAPEVATPDETEREAQASEAQLPREEKVQLQAGLQWYGHYSGALDGSIGRGTRAAMAAWQGEMGYPPTGVLTSLQRATLMANFRADEAAFGFAPYRDEEAGIEISLPAALLAFEKYEPPFVHFAARDGSNLRLLLISEPGDASTLAGLYDVLQSLDTVPSEGARSLSEGSFTLNGQSFDRGAFATASASKGAIKGYMLLWDADQSDGAQRILPALAASFRSTGDRVLDPGLVPLDDALRSGVLAGMSVKQPKATVSGIFVGAQGEVLTLSEAVANCGRITLDSGLVAEVVATDGEVGAAVLRPMGSAAPLAVAQLASESTGAGTQVLLAGYSLPTGLPAPVLTSGQVQAIGGPSGEAGMLTLAANITEHDRGGPVLDARGALVGMIFGTQTGGKTLPQGISLAVDIAAMAPLLAQAGVTPASMTAGDTPTPDALSAGAQGMTVQVACWP